MKIAFISCDVCTYGGIQKVMVDMCNYLSKLHDIAIIMKTAKVNEVAFGLADRVKTYSLDSVMKKKRSLIVKGRNFLCSKSSCFTVMDNKVGMRIMDRLYFTNAEKRRLARFINDKSFDVVIGAEPYYAFLAASIKPQLKCRVMGWMHDTYDAYFNTKGHYCYGNTMLYRCRMSLLDRIFVLSHDDKRLYEQAIDTDICVLHNPINKTSNKMSSCESDTVVFVGRLAYEHKGLNALCKIMKKVHDKLPSAELVIVGDGVGRSQLEDDIRQMGLTSCVRLVGATPDVEQYLCNAKVSVNTSAWEGFGVVIIEAMSYGLPVVSFANSGPKDIITDGEDGFLIEKGNTDAFAEKILFLLTNETERKKMSINAYEKSKEFSVEKIAEKLIGKIENIDLVGRAQNGERFNQRNCSCI